MSKEAYIRGFCKVAEENGYDPFELARMAVGFKRLKKAEAKLFVQELRKKAGYTSSQPPVRLTAPNLRRKSTAKPVSFFFTPSKSKPTAPLSPTAQVQTQVQTSPQKPRSFAWMSNPKILQEAGFKPAQKPRPAAQTETHD